MRTPLRSMPFDPTALHGLSERLLRSHHENNYAGAVRRVDAIRVSLARLVLEKTPAYELNGLKREELVAANSVLLHELYFASLGTAREAMAPEMALALQANFGSVERWREEFVALGKALAGGSGWVLLMLQPRDGTLVNQWAADHTHVLAGGVPLLALDMYEHAYHIDYGAAAHAYVDAFMANITWTAVHARYQDAVHAASEPMGAAADEIGNALVIDARRAEVFAQAQTRLPGARWCDPAQVATWGAELEPRGKVVVYCVYGHEVSRATALRLRGLGIDARFLRGGIDGWQAARPLESKGATP